ncbi:MAG: acetate--CoA ligase family protein [Candidatus Rokubacteria bacterium]|nr:acetate--CoA ligase family protein [Candidatus Rokubacteria bacterium]
MSLAGLDRLFRPRSIALLGASEDFVKISGRPLKFLLDKGYEGKIFPVNPKYTTLAGLPCYPNVAAIPEPVDLAIVALPAAAVVDAVTQCAARGIPAAVVFSSGFGEVGEDGRRLERQLADAARRGGVRLCGPNTLGFMNTFDRVMATFSQAGEGEASGGPVGFVTQSGAFGTAIFALARQRGLPFGYFVNSGNEADLEFADLLDYVVADPRVRVAAGYIEGLKDGRKLLAVAERALELGKPIVVAKVGRSSAGARAALSHTGSLAGSDRVYSGVFRQKGIVRAAHEEELLDLVSAFLHCPLPRGRGLGIVTQSGGAGVLMADRAEEIGLAVPELAEETKERLRTVIPAFGSAKNPVDITAQFIADPGLLRSSLEIVLEDPRVDAAIFYLGLMERFADQVVANLREVHAGAAKPLLVAWAGAPEAGLRALRECGICALPSATRAANAVRGLVEYAGARQRWTERRRGEVRAPGGGEALSLLAKTCRSEGRRVLTTGESFGLLSRYGVGVARSRLSRTPAEAAQAAEAIGYPVALKIESPAIRHKTEARALRLDVAGQQEVLRAFQEVVTEARRQAPEADIHGVLVQEMIRNGTEVVLGVHHDPQFGPVVMVGLGGIFVEVLEDVSFRAAPLSREDAEQMVAELRGARVLAGVRGRPPADVPSLIDALLAVSRLAADTAGEIAELDVNPLLVLPAGRGAVAVDVLAVLAEPGTGSP